MSHAKVGDEKTIEEQNQSELPPIKKQIVTHFFEDEKEDYVTQSALIDHGER